MTTTSESPSGRGRLARQWGNWAANLVVSGVIVVVGLVFGREVLQWWYVDTPVLVAGRPAAPGKLEIPAAGDSLGQPGGVEELRFGNLPVAFRHGAVVGDLAAALTVLRRECEQAANQADATSREAGLAERKMLARLRGQTPVARQEQRWELYALPRPIPIMVAVSGSESVAADERRVLAWGLLFPESVESTDPSPDVAPARWTWFTWRPSRHESGLPEDAPWPIPPDGHRTLSIRTPDGAWRLAYAGTGSPDHWRTAFDRWFAEHGWRGGVEGDAGWQRVGNGWQRRFYDAGTGDVGGTKPREQLLRPARLAEVQVILDASAALRAVLIVSPSAAGQ